MSKKKMKISVLQTILCLLLIVNYTEVCIAAYSFTAHSSIPPVYRKEAGLQWNYDDTAAWGNAPKSYCHGNQQSPIHLESKQASTANFSEMIMVNYNRRFVNTLTAMNNGHTIEIKFPWNSNNKGPHIIAGKQRHRYDAKLLHFHWGSSKSYGSEHMIDNKLFDIEIHIVHVNRKYKTYEIAAEKSDGVAVLAIMLSRRKNKPAISNSFLREIFKLLPSLIEYKSEVKLNAAIGLQDLLGNFRQQKFYAYTGSLTTPPCPQGVLWFILPQPLHIRHEDLKKFWNILDNRGFPLKNNHRPLQQKGKRKIYLQTAFYWYYS